MNMVFMLDKSGKMIECDQIHPYLIVDPFDSIEEEMKWLVYTRKSDIQWFIQNSRNSELRSGLKQLLIEKEQFDVQYFKKLNFLSNQEWVRVRALKVLLLFQTHCTSEYHPMDLTGLIRYGRQRMNAKIFLMQSLFAEMNKRQESKISFITKDQLSLISYQWMNSLH